MLKKNISGLVLFFFLISFLFLLHRNSTSQESLQEGFNQISDMHRQRRGHTLTLLDNNNVLIIGGEGTGSDTAEIFNSKSREFELIKSKMNFKHRHHRSVLLPNGKVFILEGKISELFDPKSRRFYFDPTVQMIVPRKDFSIAVLPNGKVLITGGNINSSVSGSKSILLDSAEIYDPEINKFHLINKLSEKSSLHYSLILDDKTVLLLGGNKKLIEVFYPHNGEFSIQARLPFKNTISFIPGGVSDWIPLITTKLNFTGGLLTSSLELWQYIIQNKNFQQQQFPNDKISELLQYNFSQLSDGGILIAGGWSKEYRPSKEAFILYPRTGSLINLPPLKTPIADYSSILLPSGEVLITGGTDSLDGNNLSSALIFVSRAYPVSF